MSEPATTARSIAGAWPRELVGLPLMVGTRVDSTQRYARSFVDRLLAEHEEPPSFVVAALEQTAGRGRRGRSWESAAGLGVWATVVLEVGRERVPSIPMRVGVALAESCVEFAPQVRLKWPNDLVVGGRKLGGLLVDLVAREDGAGWALIGFGIDCFHRADELPEAESTSLSLVAAEAAGERREVPGLELLLPRFVGAIVDRVRSGDDWLDRYRELSAHAKGDLMVCALENDRIEGAFAGFDERGFLRLATAAGERVLSSGDVFSW